VYRRDFKAGRVVLLGRDVCGFIAGARQHLARHRVAHFHQEGQLAVSDDVAQAAAGVERGAAAGHLHVDDLAADLEHARPRFRDHLVVVADSPRECIAKIATDAFDVSRIGRRLALGVVDLEPAAHELRVLAEIGLLIDVRILDRGVGYTVEGTGHDRFCAGGKRNACREQQQDGAATARMLGIHGATLYQNGGPRAPAVEVRPSGMHDFAVGAAQSWRYSIIQ
jgi:hypothetical protein